MLVVEIEIENIPVIAGAAQAGRVIHLLEKLFKKANNVNWCKHTVMTIHEIGLLKYMKIDKLPVQGLSDNWDNTFDLTGPSFWHNI